MDKSLRICNVKIPVPEGTLGISCSGGADSTALLYTLMKEVPDQKIIVYTAIENWRDFRILAGPAVSTIIGKTIQKVGHRDVEHKILYQNNIGQDFVTDNLYKNPIKDMQDGKISILYNAITATPEKETALSFGNINESMKKEILKRLPGQNAETWTDGGLCMPFRNHDKKTVRDIYNHYDVMDWLYPLTFSCEWAENDFDNPVHCGKCWWCHERQWAFGRLI